MNETAPAAAAVAREIPTPLLLLVSVCITRI
jgi:hypothetical protein